MTKFDFKHLQLDDASAQYELFYMPGVLHCRPAMETNRAFRDAMRADKSRLDRIVKVSNGMSAADGKADRESDRRIFPGAVIVGWEGVVDTDGNAVEFSAEECRGFLQALPDWLFDRIRLFCKSPSSFVSKAPVKVAENTAPAVEEIAGN